MDKPQHKAVSPAVAFIEATGVHIDDDISIGKSLLNHVFSKKMKAVHDHFFKKIEDESITVKAYLANEEGGWEWKEISLHRGFGVVSVWAHKDNKAIIRVSPTWLRKNKMTLPYPHLMFISGEKDYFKRLFVPIKPVKKSPKPK